MNKFETIKNTKLYEAIYNLIYGNDPENQDPNYQPKDIDAAYSERISNLRTKYKK